MGFWSWLLGKDAADDEAEPLVLGAKLKCEYGSSPSYLAVNAQDIDLNNLPGANVMDRIERVNILPFGKCYMGYDCSISMQLADKWINEVPQSERINGHEIITTNNSTLTCLHSGMTIYALTSGQDGIFAKQLQFMRQMDLDYPGLREILEDPYSSLYLDEEMRQLAIQFLSNKIEVNGGSLELINLYDPNNIEGMYVKAVMERLMVYCDVKGHELLVNDLLETAIQNGLSGTAGWDERYLNPAMFDMIINESDAYARKVAQGGAARWFEENRMVTNWAAESAYTMAYSVMMYGHIKSAQNKPGSKDQYDGKKDWRTKEEKAKAAENAKAKTEGMGKTNPNTQQILDGLKDAEITYKVNPETGKMEPYLKQYQVNDDYKVILRRDFGGFNTHDSAGDHWNLEVQTTGGNMKYDLHLYTDDAGNLLPITDDNVYIPRKSPFN